MAEARYDEARLVCDHHRVDLVLRAENRPAAAAVRLGVIGIVASITVIGGILGVAGLILSGVAMRTARRVGVGRGMYVVGMVTSSIAIVAPVLVAVFMVWHANKTHGCYQFNHLRQYEQCVSRQLHLP
ncbi:MAG: DUF4190 domain-containing protein [Acidimicrobiales bacterium]